VKLPAVGMAGSVAQAVEDVGVAALALAVVADGDLGCNAIDKSDTVCWAWTCGGRR